MEKNRTGLKSQCNVNNGCSGRTMGGDEAVFRTIPAESHDLDCSIQSNSNPEMRPSRDLIFYAYSYHTILLSR